MARVHPNGMIPSNEEDDADESICAGIDGDETNLSLMTYFFKKVFYLPCPLSRFARCLCSLLFLPRFSSPPISLFILHTPPSPFLPIFFSSFNSIQIVRWQDFFPISSRHLLVFSSCRYFYFSYPSMW